MENHFEIKPYEGILNPTFGMLGFGITHEIFKNELKISGRETISPKGNLRETTDFFRAVFFRESNQLEEIEFYDNANLYYSGIDLFHDPEAVSKILKIAKNPLEDSESLLFLDFGFTMWGIHKEADGRTVCLFKKGLFDRFLPEYKHYNPPQV